MNMIKQSNVKNGKHFSLFVFNQGIGLLSGNIFTMAASVICHKYLFCTIFVFKYTCNIFNYGAPKCCNIQKCKYMFIKNYILVNNKKMLIKK